MKHIFPLFFLLVSSACFVAPPSDSDIQTAIANTQNAEVKEKSVAPKKTKSPKKTLTKIIRPTKTLKTPEITITSTPPETHEITITSTPPEGQNTLTEQFLAKSALTNEEKEELLLLWLYGVIDYRPDDTQALQKYLPIIQIEIDRDVISYSTWESMDDDYETASLVIDLLWSGAMTSILDKDGDWGIDRIEFIEHGPLESKLVWYIDGHENLQRIVDDNNPETVRDLLESTVD